jgi:hypothetical protein
VFTNTSLAITAEDSCSSIADDNALDYNSKPSELDMLWTPQSFLEKSSIGLNSPKHSSGYSDSSDSTSKLEDC